MSLALLLPQDRIARAPLTAWAERLSSDLAQCCRSSRRVRYLSGAVAGNANNTALVATCHGEKSVARMLCERQIRWQERLSRRSKDGAVAAHVVQPWVNLARLDAMSGDWPSVLARLARLRDYRSKRCLGLGTVWIGECGWQVVGSSPQHFEATLDAMYVIDSLKALLLNQRFAEVLAFASGLGADIQPGLVRFAMEASAVAAACLGDHAGARQIVTAATRGATSWERVVFKIRMAECYACDGDPEQARRIVAPLVGVIRKVSPEKKRELQTLYVLHRLASLCMETGLHEDAHHVAHDVYEGARAAGDEVFEIESLRILSASPSRTEPRWEEALAEIEETTLYRRYRRGGREAVHSPVLNRTYEQLGDLLAN